MQNCVGQLKKHFSEIKDNIIHNSEIEKYIDKNNNKKYKVLFAEEGFSVVDLDNILKKSSLKHCGNLTAACVDVLCVNADNVKYIELKSQIGEEVISQLFAKFYYGYCKSQPILSITPYKNSEIKFVIVYTGDIKTKNIDNISEDKIKKENTTSYKVKSDDISKHYIKEWKRGFIIKTLPDNSIKPMISPFNQDIIPIIKIYYDGETPIQLDNY